jgi:hypothetical protein
MNGRDPRTLISESDWKKCEKSDIRSGYLNFYTKNVISLSDVYPPKSDIRPTLVVTYQAGTRLYFDPALLLPTK